jgi:imidazolonepropionase-like amidohydrolase
MQPKSVQSILIEGERIKAVSGGFIDPPPGGALIDLRKKFVLPGLIGCHVHLTAQLDQGLPSAASPANPMVAADLGRSPDRASAHGRR